MVESLFFGYEPFIDLQSADLYSLETLITANLIDLGQIIFQLVPRLLCKSPGIINILFEFLKLSCNSHHWRQVETLSKEGVTDPDNSISQLFSFLENNDIN